MAKTLIGNVKGPPGVTPHIGENGNWWIGETDTGVSATAGAEAAEAAAAAASKSAASAAASAQSASTNAGYAESKASQAIDAANAAEDAQRAAGTAQNAAENAQTAAASSAATAQKAATQAQECLTEVETKLANGEFDGAPGQRGTGILKVTTAPSSYTTAIGSYTPKYRIALSTVKSQAKVDEVLLGDVIQYSFYQYFVDYMDATYAYISVTRTSIRGAAGPTPVKGTDYWTDADKQEIVDEVVEMVSTTEAVPDYWLEHLADKASAIQTAMEKAGRHKSAFLWYTDAHWPNGNSKVSPALLKYLYEHTSMNKVNFGGDIIGDTLLATRDDMEYLYEWRRMIKGLPNHHSVFGNHDNFALDTVDYEDENYRYAFLLAPEETNDMVMGNGNYYYMDNHAEKTRYLYFDYIAANQTAMMAQGQFFVNAIKGVPEGWHIVAIGHRWWQYSKSATPLVGSVPGFEADMLSVFDAYNARTTRSGSNYFYAQDFTDAKGKVEFCIGGHIHVDYDFESTGGIPVIITTSDTNQNRVPDSTVDSGTVGTTTEAAVFGIIADYTDADNTKINVIGVGRGTSRVVRKSTVKPTSISDITYSGDTTVGATIDKSKFRFTVNYNTGATDTINGAASVSPATIGVVGDNAVTITYIEGATTVSGTVTIVGTAVPVANLFDKNDADVVDTGRFNSSNAAVAYQSGQLVTGYIAATVGDTFTVISDKSAKTNNYTGTGLTYKTDKSAIGQFAQGSSFWNRSADGLTSTITIPATNGSTDHSATAYIRFCVAYTDIDSIVITKA